MQAYVSPNASAIAPAFKAPDGTWTGGAARARLLLVNEKLVKPEEMPRSVRDLTNTERRATALYVTHDPREAQALGQGTAVLDEGRVVHVGRLDELSSRADLPFARRILDPLG